MKEIINFYQSNKEIVHLVAYVIISVISTILVCCLKKKKVLNEMDLILVDVFEKLPGFIIDAEPFKGAELKKSLVLEAVKTYVKDKFSVNLSSSSLALISFMIEKILETPQKKSIDFKSEE